MPLTVTLQAKSRTGLVMGSGTVTGSELLEACIDLLDAPGWEPGFDEIWDLTPAHQVDVSPEELTALVTSTKENADRFGKNRVVVVTQSDSFSILMRLYRRLTASVGRVHCTVRTREEAEAWLGGDAAVCLFEGKREETHSQR